MKKAKSIFLVSALFASAFFLSCGVPEILYPIESENYTFSRDTSADSADNQSYYIELSFTSDDMDGKLSECYGPNVMLFYVVSTQDSYSSIYSSVKSTFNSNYKINGYQGYAIETDGNRLDNVTFTENDATRYAYLFSIESSSENTDQKFEAPIYVYGKQGTGSAAGVSSNFYLEYVNDSDTEGHLELYYKTDTADEWGVDDGTGITTYPTTLTSTSGYVDTGLSLYRYNGQPFATTVGGLDSDDDKEDYDDSEVQSATTLYVHLFAAFCITPSSGSDFNNIFWSDVVALGTIEIGATGS